MAISFKITQLKSDDEFRSLTDHAGYFYGSSVKIHDMLDDGQPQPGAADIARTPCVDAVEALEYPREMPGVDPDSGITHGDPYGILRLDASDIDGAARFVVFNGITDQIDHHLLDPVLICCETGFRLHIRMNGDTVFECVVPQKRDHFGCDLFHAAGFRIRFIFAVFDFGQVQDVLNQIMKPLRLDVDDVKETERGFPIIDRTGFQCLHESADRCQRGLQLMRDIGDKIRADLLQIPQLRDVVDVDDGIDQSALRSLD
jgi:hypothetical protein